MAKRWKIANLSPTVRAYEGHMIQPRTSRVLDLENGFSERSIDRLRSRGVLVAETGDEAQNGQPLPAADPALVDAYARLATAEGAAREEVLASIGFGATQPKKGAAAQAASAPAAGKS